MKKPLIPATFPWVWPFCNGVSRTDDTMGYRPSKRFKNTQLTLLDITAVAQVMSH
jgi:hypothetical protein